MRPITEVLTRATMGEWAKLMEDGKLMSIACRGVAECRRTIYNDHPAVRLSSPISSLNL